MLSSNGGERVCYYRFVIIVTVITIITKFNERNLEQNSLFAYVGLEVVIMFLSYLSNVYLSKW